MQEIEPSKPVEPHKLTLEVGAIIALPGLRLEVVATNDFEKCRFFPDAVAEVKMVGKGWVTKGSHLNTPWGVVKIT